VRDVARRLGISVIVCGDDLEGARFWDGVAVERRHGFDSALADAACVVLPAYVEHQPRRLLRAVAMGVPVIASDACGLGELPNVTTVCAGDVAALSAAVELACELARATPVLSSRG
jgi:glycosyltransferase involved in cell wall biosynthesis